MINDPAEYQRPAWISVILILLTVLTGFVVVGPLIGFMLALPFTDGDLTSLTSKLANPTQYPELKIPLYIMQGCATFIGLIVGPALYMKAFEKRSVLLFFKDKKLYPKSILITAIVVVVFMIPNSFFIEWNSNLTFPDFMNDWEAWAREKEEIAAQLTTYLTTFNSLNEFLIAFLVIAVIPGIGEELVFRGMLQPALHRSTGNIHAAIWISALLFSAIHLQFFGFVPRLLLGVMFGYLYYWSGNIIVPMFAHFVNNGFSVVMVYLYQQGAVPINMESTESAPLPLVMLFTLITFGLLLYLKKFHRENKDFVL